MSFDHLAPRDESAVLRARVDRLRSSLHWAREAIPLAVRDELHATVDRCEERLRLGIDWTVIALAGGPGRASRRCSTRSWACRSRCRVWRDPRPRR
ncbi:hypothetical protein [Demequina sediminis]|uniref:hypothetical protein n=1 Tax=Demequina sediminis TaxID=1930058 RepID=UPI002572DEF7|nr:hypothetical protein [Demequina sediminis]